MYLHQNIKKTAWWNNVVNAKIWGQSNKQFCGSSRQPSFQALALRWAQVQFDDTIGETRLISFR